MAKQWLDINNYTYNEIVYDNPLHYKDSHESVQNPNKLPNTCR